MSRPLERARKVGHYRCNRYRRDYWNPPKNACAREYRYFLQIRIRRKSLPDLPELMGGMVTESTIAGRFVTGM